jgi:hypothetical protein
MVRSRHDDHLVSGAAPEGAASPEVITPALVSAPSWSIEIGSVNPRRTVRGAPQASGRGPLFRGTRSADHAGRRLETPTWRLGLGVTLDVNRVISRRAAERAARSACLRKVCPLRTRCLLRGPGPRIEGNLGAGLERVRLILVGCRCLGFVHGATPFDLHRSGRLSSPSMTR